MGYFMTSPPVHYTKPSTTVDEQIERLKERGMLICDKRKTALWLRRVGYYRLSGYWYELRELDASAPTPHRTNNFKPGTRFSDVAALYLFDEQLRILMLKAISSIEVALRAHLVSILAPINPKAYLDKSFFNSNFTNIQNGQPIPQYYRWLEKIKSSVERSRKEPFVEHFFQKYCSAGDPNNWNSMPLWIMVDCWDFGLLSKCCSGLDLHYSSKIAKNYSMPAPILVSWLYTLNTARNFAAHHSRVWNRWWNVAPPIMPSKNYMNGFFAHIHGAFKANPKIQKSTYMVLAIIKYFLTYTVEDRGQKWASEIKELLSQMPCAFGDSGKLGFPKNWSAEALWN